MSGFCCLSKLCHFENGVRKTCFAEDAKPQVPPSIDTSRPDLHNDLCSTIRWMLRSPSIGSRSPQPAFYTGQALQHAITERAVGQDFLQTSNHLRRREIILHEFCDDLLLRD